MPVITAKVDITKAVAGLRDFEKKQLPFAAAATLTALAKDGQAATKVQVRGAFTLRNTWTESGIRIKPADKTTLKADVHTDTANRKTGAPDYLGRQEGGGEKVPVNGRQHIAVPTKALRFLNGPGTIKAEFRPAALMGAVAGRYTAYTRKGQIALRKQGVRTQGLECFVQKLKNGHLAILGRYKGSRDAVPLYMLISEAHIRKSGLEMEQTVQRIVNENMQMRWDGTWTKIYARGLRI